MGSPMVGQKYKLLLLSRNMKSEPPRLPTDIADIDTRKIQYARLYVRER